MLNNMIQSYLIFNHYLHRKTCPKLSEQKSREVSLRTNKETIQSCTILVLFYAFSEKKNYITSNIHYVKE